MKAASRKSKSSASDAPVQERVWQRAIRLLAAHDRSEQEIRARLAPLAAPPEVIDATLQRLRDLRFLDDSRFAVAVAERAVRRGHGSDYVRAQLMMKGVDEALSEAVVAAAFTDEGQLARQVLERRYPTPPQRSSERAKAARFLHQRGFPEAVVLAILEEGC